MVIPNLFSKANPNAPRWTVPVLDAVEARGLSQSIAMIVCPHPATNAIVQWGSGVIVAALEDGIWIVTSAHLFSDWLDHAEPSARTTSPRDLAVRLRHSFDEGVFRVIVDFGAPIGRRSCRLDAASFAQTTANDVALLHVEYPKGVDASGVTVLPLDFDAFPVWSPVLIAGYSGAEIHIDYDKSRAEEHTDAATGHLHCRVGHVAEGGRAAGTLNGSMYGIGIPTLRGMSGGPVILDRNLIESVSHVFPRHRRFPLTVVGVISRDCGTASLLDACRDGETWASPVSHAMELSVAPSRTLRDAIAQGTIPVARVSARARHS